MFEAGEIADDEVFLGMQYYQGEPVKLVESRNEDRNIMHIARTDKSQEQLLENVENISAMEWFTDGEGAVYGWKRPWALKEDEERFLIKYSSAGEEIHRWNLGEKMILQDMCKLQDGRIALLLQDERDGTDKLGEAEAVKDTITLLDGIGLDQSTGSRYISPGEKGVLVLDTGISGGISEISMEDGSRIRSMAFSGISGMSFSLGMELNEKDLKEMEIQDFRMREDGMIEMLWANSINGQGIQENLILTKIERNFIRLRTFAAGSWLQGKDLIFYMGRFSTGIVSEV